MHWICRWSVKKWNSQIPQSRMTMKKFLALTGLIVACFLPFAAQSLECSVKPKVTSIEAPHSYMFVGNSYTYYSSGLAGAVNGLAKAAGIKVRRNRMVTIGAADLGWFNVWELVRPSGMSTTATAAKSRSLTSGKKRFLTLSFFRTTAPVRSIRSAKKSLRSMQNSMHTICSVLASNLWSWWLGQERTSLKWPSNWQMPQQKSATKPMQW